MNIPIHSRTLSDSITIIDDIDADLAQHSWRLTRNGYAMSTICVDKKWRNVYLHRMILERITERSLSRRELGDHANHDKLDNRRHNLRVASYSQNGMNGLKRKETTSQYKGVYWHKSHNRWMARAFVDGKNIWLGYFLNETEAAQAYDEAAKNLYGEFAHLNLPG